MTQTSRNRLRIGTVSLLAAAVWQTGAAAPGTAQVIVPEPTLIAPPAANPSPPDEVPTVSLTSPAMTGPLTANQQPFGLDTGFPLGKIYFGGAITGMGLFQSQPVPGNNSAEFDMPSGLVWLQNNEGALQFFVMAGGYSFPTLGTPYTHMPTITMDTFKPVPIAYGKIVYTDEISLQVGKLPTLIGAEYAFTFQNMNIQRGLLWNQEPLISRGIQGNYASGPLSVSLSWNDGFYSNNYSWISGLASYTLNKENTIAIAGGGAFNAVAKSSFVTPTAQNNSRIINLIYTYNSEPWTITPYFQFTGIPSNANLGIDHSQTWGGAILANYKINDSFSIAGRGEIIASTGSGNVLYGAGSSAGSLTVTPTYQLGVWFLRGEASVVHVWDSPGAFGDNGTAKTQVRGVIEAGVIF